jgi:hypothetical protein
MSARIEQLVKDSFADQYFEKAITCLKLLRDQCKMVGIHFHPLFDMATAANPGQT